MQNSSLSLTAQQELLVIARQAMETVIKGELFNPRVRSEELLAYQGAFVTLTKGGRLRGCIGTVESREPLYKTVTEMAVQAAFSDPRFSALTSEELSPIKIEISLLSPLEKIKNTESIKMGTHGVMIKAQNRRGLFLPQVAHKTGWTTEQFLFRLCEEKMGLSGDTWREPDTEIYIFTVETIEEP